MIGILITGFAMALADSVPGVSGGTVVFILGYYDKFITSLSDLFHGTKGERIHAVNFLGKLACGWIIGMSAAALFLSQLFINSIYQVSSLFLGFVLASLPVICVEEKKTLKSSPHSVVFAALGAFIVIAITTLNLSSTLHGLTFTAGTSLYALAAGALAVSAMVLPGISGSSLLMAFGLYIPVITGIHDLLSRNLSSLWLLAALGIGVLLGIIFILRGIKLLLDRHRSAMIYAVLGMMVGSLYAIAKGPETLANPLPMMTMGTFHGGFFLAGCALLIGLYLVKTFILRKEAESRIIHSNKPVERQH
ncbi:MAG: DUF368 domain-containing protein [Anaerovoracaceae bacterium]|jgi:putative membrane protein